MSIKRHIFHYIFRFLFKNTYSLVKYYLILFDYLYFFYFLYKNRKKDRLVQFMTNHKLNIIDLMNQTVYFAEEVKSNVASSKTTFNISPDK